MNSRTFVVPGIFVLAALLLVLVLAAVPLGGGLAESSPLMSVVATDLNNPRGLTIGPDGGLYIAEAGAGGAGPCVVGPEGEVCYGASGGVSRVLNGVQDRLVSDMASLALVAPGQEGFNAIGPHEIAFDGSGSMYVIVGLGADPAIRNPGGPLDPVGMDFGQLAMVNPDWSWQNEIDVAGYEAIANPDGGAVDSNPFSIHFGGNDNMFVADAGGNSLLEVSTGPVEEGGVPITTTAIFSDTLVEFPPGSGNMIPMQAVPTAVDLYGGSLFVGQLTGFPFPVGGSSVWQVDPPAAPVVYEPGFTNVLDVEFDDAGNLYVLEMFTNGILSEDPTGALIKIAPDGTRTTLASDGLVTPTGMALGDNGCIYVSNYGVFPGTGAVTGQVVCISTAPTSVSLSQIDGQAGSFGTTPIALLLTGLVVVGAVIVTRLRRNNQVDAVNG